MKLVLPVEKYRQMPYYDTDVSKAKTFGEIVGLLEAYGIHDYDWKKRKAVPPFTVADEALEFPLDYKRADGSNASVLVHIDVPQIYKENKKGESEYMEKTSWRLFWWFMKARLEAAFYGISSLEREFLYLITDDRGVKLGDRIMKAIESEGLDKVLLEDKSPEDLHKHIDSAFKVIS